MRLSNICCFFYKAMSFPLVGQEKMTRPVVYLFMTLFLLFLVVYAKCTNSIPSYSGFIYLSVEPERFNDSLKIIKLFIFVTLVVGFMAFIVNLIKLIK